MTVPTPDALLTDWEAADIELATARVRIVELEADVQKLTIDLREAREMILFMADQRRLQDEIIAGLRERTVIGSDRLPGHSPGLWRDLCARAAEIEKKLSSTDPSSPADQS